MKKQRKKAQTRKKSAGQQAAAAPGRRDVLKLAKMGVGGAIALSALGYFGARSVSATIREHDLTRIGQGTPAVVQIHDPSCALCRGLQRETRAALKAVDSDALLYLVADINTAPGQSLAARNRVQHVTLLLLDGAGRTREVITGPQDRADLEAAFKAHIARTH